MTRDLPRRPASGRTSGPALGLAVALALAACSPGGGGPTPRAAQDAERGVQERRAARVLVEPLERREMLRELQTTCVVESDSEVRLLPRATGPYVEVLAEEGDRVAAGQVLARIEPREAELALRDAENAVTDAEQTVGLASLAVREAEASVDNAELALAQAERDLERNESLRTGGENRYGSVAETAVEASRLARDQAAHDLRQAQLAVERAQLEASSAEVAHARAEVARDQAALALEYTEVVAPFDGVIAERLVKAGDTASGAEPCFVVTDPEDLRAVFYRPQRELDLFTGGGALALTARTEAHPGARFEGRVQRTSPTIDPESGQFRVTATFDRTAVDEPGATLLPGMLVRLTVVTDRRPDALVAPKRAVLREGDDTHVLVVRDGVARRVVVDEGYASPDHVEVVPRDPDGLAAGDRVVVVGGRDLEDGDAVAVEGDPPAVAPEGGAPEDAVAEEAAGEAPESDDVDGGRVADGDA